MKTNKLYYLLVALVAEKLIQHIFVTAAFYFNWGDIAATVVVAPDVLMVLGAVIAVLFCVALWGLIKKRSWTIDLVIALALFDIVGEFVAQGRIDIAIPVSFIVAVLLLVAALVYRRKSTRT